MKSLFSKLTQALVASTLSFAGVTALSTPAHAFLWKSEDLADPSCYTDGGSGATTYCYATQGNGKYLQCYDSGSSYSIHECIDLTKPIPSFANGNLWAPSGAKFGSNYVLWYSLASKVSGHQVISSMKSSSNVAWGNFFDVHTSPVIDQGSSGGAIDPEIFKDPNGGAYLVWKNDGNAVGQDTWIWSQPLSTDGMSLTGSASQLFKQTQSWEGNLVEGPSMWRDNGQIYVLYSANNYGNSSYATGYAKCSSPTGGCTKPSGSALMATNSNANCRGPGGLTVFMDNGSPQHVTSVYHAWDDGTLGYPGGRRGNHIDGIVFSSGAPVIAGGAGCN